MAIATRKRGRAWPPQKPRHYRRLIAAIGDRERELEHASDVRIDDDDVVDVFAKARVAARRALKQRPFDVQIWGGLAMAAGAIAEMQTGEGKTLAAVPVAALLATQRKGVHVMTANDYLAQRDAAWMRPVYELLGLDVGFVQQGMSTAERKQAYAADITYGTATEFGFDFLRDRIAYEPDELVQRAPFAAIVDEIDSILIDEARVPLVIAGGDAVPDDRAYRAAEIAATLDENVHWELDHDGRTVRLLPGGVDEVFRYDVPQHAVRLAVQARALARRDVEYIVRDERIEIIDEFKGRTDPLRRWPSGFHTAVEAKERLPLTAEAKILGQITLQRYVHLYRNVCGMTATARTSTWELGHRFGLRVVAVPSNRPCVRDDRPDVIFAKRDEKESAVVAEVARAHASGRPVLVGTASVAESDRIACRLRDAGIACEVLNARDDEREAAIIARAGTRDAVTISTNMAGRGTDIRLGEGVAELGGLYVIGTNRHEARRIDLQLRGRAGRQGDPGSSKYFVSLEDPLFVRYRAGDLTGDTESLRIPDEGPCTDKRVRAEVARAQELVDLMNGKIRARLDETGAILERHRKLIDEWRDAVVHGRAPERERIVALTAIDFGWAEHLAEFQELKSASLEFFFEAAVQAFAQKVDAAFAVRMQLIRDRIAEALSSADPDRFEALRPAAKWTYLLDEVPRRTEAYNWLTLVRVLVRDGFRPFTDEERLANELQ